MARTSPHIEDPSSVRGWVVDRNPTAWRDPEHPFVFHGAAAGLDRHARPASETPLSVATTFVSTLAHEIRQPLSVLLATVDVVCRSDDPELAGRAAEIMRRQIGQMDRIVEDVLDATRWAHGSVTLRKQRIDVRDAIRNAALDAATAVEDRGHQLIVDSGVEPLWADADLDRIHQMLSNLLRNAVKYTDPGGRIWLHAVRHERTVTLHVRDTGRGIARDALTGIFDLFSQVQPSDASGLGIGLSVVREIATLHGGHVVARSDGPGHGSEFIVTVPLAPAPGET